MAIADFVHLKVRSAYSLTEGANKIEKIVALAKEQSMPAVAVTDRNNLFGALEFSQYASKGGIQPIVGCDLGIRREEEGGIATAGKLAAADWLTLLVQSETGYRNLMRLVSRAHLDFKTGSLCALPLEMLDGHTDGLLAFTGSAGSSLGRLLSAGQTPAAIHLLERLQRLFDDRLYIELQRHNQDDERRIEGQLLDLAYSKGLPLVGTNDVHFPQASMYEAHDVLLCIEQGVHIEDPNRRRLTRQHYFKSAAEMRAVFADLPEACDNTLTIAQRCAYMPAPRKPILPRYTKLGGRAEKDALKEMADRGLAALKEQGRLSPDIALDEYEARLVYELNMIEKMGFSGYFLIVADFIQWAKDNGIPVGPGRGSGAGSLVAWSLKITDLDPLRWGLLFERFLNPERVSMPDFDIDFCQDKRDRVIRYVRDEYGHDRVAAIITFGKLQARAVLRDVGRVLGMPYGQVDRICKLVPNNPAKPVTLAQALGTEQLLKEQYSNDEEIKRLIDLALQLEGLYRNASTHAAGVVIGDRPLEELVPLYRDTDSKESLPATQFNMKWVETAGLVKFDFLGLKTLTVIEKACGLIGHDKIDIAKIPLDDEATFRMLARGDAYGVFQMEGSGMRDILSKLKPNRFEDLIALVALYRPGPMDDIPTYISVKNGQEKPDYLHPSLKGILEETYGIMVYQEQVMQIAQVLSGYSLGGADLLRRAMGKKIQSEMDAQRATFIEGARKNNVEDARASMIFDKVAKFAGYGFNKCHSAPYALVAYQTAYLRANYPVEFFAASMTLDMGNTDKLGNFRRELERLKVPLLGPDVNKSMAEFAVETTADGVQGGALCALRHQGRRPRGDGSAGGRADRERPVQGSVRRLRTSRPEGAEQAPGREFGEGGGLRFAEQEPRPGLRRHRGAGSPFAGHAGVARQQPEQPVRRRYCPAPAAAAQGAGLGADGAPAERVRGDRLLSLLASAGGLRAQPAAAGRHPRRRPAGAAAARCAGPHQACRHDHRSPGAHLGQGQPLCFRAVLRPIGCLRAHRVQRASRQQAQPAGTDSGGAGHRRRAARWRAGEAHGPERREARGCGGEFGGRAAHRDLRPGRARCAAQEPRRQARAGPRDAGRAHARRVPGRGHLAGQLFNRRRPA